MGHDSTLIIGLAYETSDYVSTIATYDLAVMDYQGAFWRLVNTAPDTGRYVFDGPVGGDVDDDKLERLADEAGFPERDHDRIREVVGSFTVGNNTFTEDRYGRPLKELDLPALINALESDLDRDAPYRRIPPALALLRSFHTTQGFQNTHEKLVVLHYGH